MQPQYIYCATLEPSHQATGKPSYHCLIIFILSPASILGFHHYTDELRGAAENIMKNYHHIFFINSSTIMKTKCFPVKCSVVASAVWILHTAWPILGSGRDNTTNNITTPIYTTTHNVKTSFICPWASAYPYVKHRMCSASDQIQAIAFKFLEMSEVDR